MKRTYQPPQTEALWLETSQCLLTLSIGETTDLSVIPSEDIPVDEALAHESIFEFSWE